MFITKIVNEEQAEKFVEFATKKFSTIKQLIEWLKLIRDELGVVEEKEFSMPLHDNENQPKQFDYLILNFDNKGMVLFTGHIYENCQESFIVGKTDFTESQYYCKNFIDLKIKVDQYHDAVKQAQQIYDEIISRLSARTTQTSSTTNL